MVGADEDVEAANVDGAMPINFNVDSLKVEKLLLVDCCG